MGRGRRCPIYIHVRHHEQISRERPTSRVAETGVLSPEARALIQQSDTFFIATTSGQKQGDWTKGVDVSHRGGDPGFLRLQDTAEGTRLLVPDYAGNGFFNTLGNLALDPRAGLLFVDITAGNLLQLAGRAQVFWHDAETVAATGATRTLVLDVAGGQWLRDVLELRWG